ncbi:MAG TPA: hypothetical protein PK228_14855, partial [Saprospiraceae bacterium]|nr:hypothetical protein [Saprospiraceae bacterium]
GSPILLKNSYSVEIKINQKNPSHIYHLVTRRFNGGKSGSTHPSHLSSLQNITYYKADADVL